MTPRQRANQATLAETANMFDVTMDMLHYHIRKGNLPARKTRRGGLVRWIVDLEDVEALMDARRGVLALARDLKAAGADNRTIARELGVSVRTVQRWVR